MREIKFRAWDKAEQKMYGPFTLGDLYGYEGEVNAVTLRGGQELTICSHSGGSIGYPQLPADNGINPDVELMQFTGLHDRSGKEVYEGDIVRGYRNEYGVILEDIEQVQYDDDMQLMPFHRISDYDATLWMHFILSTGFEVIGNIYENSELLEATR